MGSKQGAKPSIMTVRNHVADTISTGIETSIKDQIGKLPEQVVMEFGDSSGTIDDLEANAAASSNWRDKFTRDRWYDTWGRGGT